ncbi:hypothetical protein ISN45_Aa03g024470 [Arabidopsis thaliana x Arabidopsis arenosa]|uniref:Uncharacterized protein n=1 Tax=Arabidopsis thaliana x Arabidopsis arenosa TaxID=1240361 RepID=A0A8T2AY86_9BRAS|nr:hypothetical protein ISN45_Aa03g024470 [Arabidopsis thaliana x Arabidopsis arenosa]
MTFPTSLGAYTSPPPIGYPTRDAVVGDPPAAAVETKSKDGQEASTCCGYIFISFNPLIFFMV